MKPNCWEVMKCGREPGGINSKQLGVCPASTMTEHHNKNGGLNGGRICWIIAGTICEGSRQGTFVEKVLDCIHCPFFKQVQDEEEDNLET